MASVGLIGAQDMQNVSSTLQSNNLGNNAAVEMHWAIAAGEHAEVYFNLISSVDPRFLHLTPLDNEIYTKFRETFPDMKVNILDEDEMKSPHGKMVWRHFIEQFKDKVEDYNQGTLLRIDSSKEYTEENSIVCIRTQFLAIEIARNRENHNRSFHFTQDGCEEETRATAS